MGLKKNIIYLIACSICLCPGASLAEESAQEGQIPVISGIEQKVEQIILNDHQKAVQYAQDGDMVAAYHLIQKAYTENPEDTGIVTDYIAIAAWMEKFDEAVSVYENHPGLDLPDHTKEALIKAFRESGDYASAIRLSREFLKTHPENLDVAIGLIYSFIRAGEYGLAAEQLTLAEGIHPGHVRLKSLKALLSVSQKDWQGFFQLGNENKEVLFEAQDPAVMSDLNESFYLVYDEAITFARNDQFDEALGLLDRLGLFEHKSQQIQMDRIVIHIWQEKFGEALSEYQQMEIEQAPPPYFLEEVARAYKRNDEEVMLPETHWRYIEPYVKAIEEEEYKDRVRLSFIRSHIEEGDIQKALEQVDEILTEDPQHQEALFLKAEIYDAADEYWKAVQVYNQIMKIYPDNHAAFNLKLRSLMDLGATSLVLQAAEANPDIVDPIVVERARTNVPMHEIRWEEPKPALQKIAQLEEEYSASVAEGRPDEKISENHQRVKWDRFLALRQEERMQEIVDEYEALIDAGTAVPPWVERSAGDAYLYLERPEEALEIFEKLARDDQSFDVQMSVYYTLVELGRYKEAQETLERIDEITPVKIVERGILQDNWRKADIAFNKAWLLMYQDRLKEAQGYIKDVNKISPFNTNLRTAEAHNRLYRGWKRQALEDFRAIRTMDNTLISAQIGYARALNENMEKEKAREEVNGILEKKPTNKHALRLKREFDVEEMSTVTFGASYTAESPGEDEYTLSLRGDQPVGFHHNLFVEVVRRETTQEGSNDIARKVRIGDEWQINNNWRLVGALTGDHEKTDELGFLGEIRYQPDDYWTFDFGYESDTLDIPSRSRKNGVEADLYTLSATYRASELFDTTLGVSYKDFTDGNEYLNYFWLTDTALTTSAYWKTRLGTEFSYETFADQDVDYFSPEEVYSFYLVPMVEHTWFRRYERFWVDRLYFGIGQKWQKGFGASDVGYVRYEQEHQFSDTKSWLIGATYSMNEYDDESVDSLNVYTTLRFKF